MGNKQIAKLSQVLTRRAYDAQDRAALHNPEGDTRTVRSLGMDHAILCEDGEICYLGAHSGIWIV